MPQSFPYHLPFCKVSLASLDGLAAEALGQPLAGQAGFLSEFMWV